MKWLLLLPFFSLLFYQCSNSNSKGLHQHTEIITTNKYAKGFNIKKINESNYQITINNPWQEVDNIQYTYTFRKVKEDSLSIDPEAIIQPERVMCLSTTHIAFIEKINAIDKIIGVSNPKLVYSEKFKERFNNGYVADIGFDQSLNFETIINAQPDLIFIYGVGGENAQFYNKLSQLGLNTIFIGEYLEENPLAKLEWIKLFGLLFNKQEEANQLFSDIEEEYIQGLRLIPNKVDSQKIPKVLFNLPWKGTWFVPGGKSYLAQMISLCNGQYIWENNDSRSTIPLSIESVLIKGNQADIWLNPGNAKTKNDILLEDSRLKSFPPFQNGEIYNFNNRINDNGGNDYWESGVVNPHLVLKDLIAILHPEVLPNHKFYYYRKIE